MVIKRVVSDGLIPDLAPQAYIIGLVSYSIMPSELLAPRYRLDGHATRDLDKKQQRVAKRVQQKINNDIYQFKQRSCPVCDEESNFRTIAEKDRYGLYNPVSVCKNCGLVQTNPRMSEESYAEFYEEEYRELYKSDTDWEAPLFERRREKAETIYQYID